MKKNTNPVPQEKNYIWQGAVPDWLKKTQRPIHSAMEPCRPYTVSHGNKPSNIVSSEDIKKIPAQSLSNFAKNKSPLYSMKYLGITNGQIGILSKRAPIPYISPLEACKDVPFALINSSLNDRNKSTRLLNRLISNPEQLVFQPEPAQENIEKIEDDFPDPNLYNEYIIHTYARPRGLMKVNKNDEPDQNQPVNKPIQIPYHRVGFSGWKLSRPKSSNPNRYSNSARSLLKTPDKNLNRANTSNRAKNPKKTL